MPMVIMDCGLSDHPIVLANKAFLQLSGYTAEEVVGRNCRFLQGEETSPEAVAEIRRAVEKEQELEIEILNYRKDGSAFWNQLSLSPVDNEEGRLIYFFASQIDVTEFRKIQILEASENRLLREVDHRSKNALAIVNSIVRLSRADDTARYADAVQRRVGVLRAHALLAERGWREVSLLQVIDGQLRRPSSARISFRGDDVMISALDVQPVALVVHELFDNAVRHGALAVPHGALNVTWTMNGNYGGFDLCWHEKGVALPSAGSRAGFGGAVMVEKQLGGRLERDWVDGGYKIALHIPGRAEGR